MEVREARVSGQFYPGEKDRLKKEISNFFSPFKDTEKKINALGLMLPHAGYIYSAKVACSVLAKVRDYTNYILLGPNHTGYGKALSVSNVDAWKTPLGQVRVNESIKNDLFKSGIFELDNLAHQLEHSIEVELPLLQYVNRDNFDIIAIAVAESGIETLREAGLCLAETIKKYPSTLIIASSDMTHYQSQEEAKKQDKIALEAILNLDEEALIKRVREHGISMCGFAAVALMMVAAKALGAKKGELINYQTSADYNNDYESVVGYAGVIIS